MILIAALVLSLLIKTFLVQAFYIPSSSMEDTLKIGDRVFVSKLTTRIGSIERGDIVVFADPGGWLPDVDTEPQQGVGRVRSALHDGLQFVGLAPSTTGDDLIKRVIGIGGDRVEGRAGQVYVNGVRLDEPYVYPGDTPTDVDFSVTVPRGSIWVMGDHRSVSEDSRAHQDLPGRGFVPLREVVGRAVLKVWPLDRGGGLPRPDTFGRPELSTG